MKTGFVPKVKIHTEPSEVGGETCEKAGVLWAQAMQKRLYEEHLNDDEALQVVRKLKDMEKY